MIISALWGSLVKMIKDDILVDLATLGYSFEFIDWDKISNVQELRNVDLIGPTSFGSSSHQGFVELAFSIGFSTVNDENLFRMRDAADLVFERLQPEKTFPIYDPSTLNQNGVVVFRDGTTLAPIARDELRPFQFVQCNGEWHTTYTSS